MDESNDIQDAAIDIATDLGEKIMAVMALLNERRPKELQLTSEDLRAIAISGMIEANRILR